jgi:CubicO group peptidase (beta-lactamase class C family)
VLEAVTGKSYEQLVKMRIAKPLGLRTVRMAPDSAALGGTTVVGYDGAKQLPSLNVRTFGAAGALTGSASDLAKFDRALMTGKLLSLSARTMAWSGNPKLGYQALGIWAYPARLKGCSSPVEIVERRGDVNGTQVRNIIAPVLGRAVIVFTNDAAVDFGEVWQGNGLTHDLLAAAFCPQSPN